MDLRPPATNFGRKPKPTKQKYPFSAHKLTKDANSFIRTDGQTDRHSDKQTIESVHPYTTMSPLHPYMGFGTWKWWALNHALGITIISIGPLSTHWPFPHLPVRNDKSEPKVANRTLELTMKVVMLTIYSTRTWKSFQIKCPSFQPLVRSTDRPILQLTETESDSMQQRFWEGYILWQHERQCKREIIEWFICWLSSY